MTEKQSKKKRVFKLFLIGMGSIIVLSVLSLAGFYISLSMTLNDIEMTEYHPFRSAKAKEQVIAAFDAFEKAAWPIESKTVYIDTSYGKTFVRISGSKTAPPLVLIHGMGSNSLFWCGNIEPLSKNHRTYAIDTINDNGLSIYTRVMRSSDEYVNWLDELFTVLDLGDNIILLGESYGGWLTSQYALRFQDRLSKIVLLAPAATILPLSKQYIARMMLSVLPFRYFNESFFSWLNEDSIKKDKSDFDNMMAYNELISQCFKPNYAIASPTVLDDNELQGIKVPTLILVGENEKIYSAHEAIERLNRVAPGIKTEMIPNAGHDLRGAQNELVTKKVLEFLEE